MDHIPSSLDACYSNRRIVSSYWKVVPELTNSSFADADFNEIVAVALAYRVDQAATIYRNMRNEPPKPSCIWGSWIPANGVIRIQ